MYYIPRISYRKAGLRRPGILQSEDNPSSLPRADVVVFSWTNYAAAAIDHVFFNYRRPFVPNTSDWQYLWNTYTQGLMSREESYEDIDSWCNFRLTRVGKRKVLLVKSNLHFKYEPYQILEFLDRVFIEVRPSLAIFHDAIGGSLAREHIGDVVAVNSAHILALGDLADASFNHQTYGGQFSPDLSALTPFSKYYLPPSITKRLISDIAYRIGLSYDQIVNTQQFPRAPHPYFYPLFSKPVLTVNEFIVASSSESCSEYAGLGEDAGPFFCAAERHGIDALGFCAISDPWANDQLPEEEQVRVSNAFYMYAAEYVLINAARTVLRYLSK